jgi:hypothetical protein
MNDRITIKGRDGAFGAYIVRPKVLPAPAVVVLHEVFGVNTDIRKHCDELAEQGFIAVAPDLFWRQEPGVDLSVTSEPDWQRGLRLNQAYDRDAAGGVSLFASGIILASNKISASRLVLGLVALKNVVQPAVVFSDPAVACLSQPHCERSGADDSHSYDADRDHAGHAIPGRTSGRRFRGSY